MQSPGGSTSVRHMRWRDLLRLGMIGLAAMATGARPARALEAVVFVSSSSPGEVW